MQKSKNKNKNKSSGPHEVETTLKTKQQEYNPIALPSPPPFPPSSPLLSSSSLPPPPLLPLPQLRQRNAAVETTTSPPTEKPQTELKELEIEPPPFAELIRGEEFTPLKNVFEIYQAFQPTEDVAAVLAFGICGSKKKIMFLYRSLHKFMLWYEETERKLFKPGTYNKRKAKETKIYTWREWKEVVRKGKCMMNREQVSIIARLY